MLLSMTCRSGYVIVTTFLCGSTSVRPRSEFTFMEMLSGSNTPHGIIVRAFGLGIFVVIYWNYFDAWVQCYQIFGLFFTSTRFLRNPLNCLVAPLLCSLFALPFFRIPLYPTECCCFRHPYGYVQG